MVRRIVPATGKLFVGGALLAGLLVAAFATDLPAPPVHPNGGKLWQIVGGACLPAMKANKTPAPCTAVEDGYVILKDRVGIAQYLLMPDMDITGIEDARVQTVQTNFFAKAWENRNLVAIKLGKNVSRDVMSVTVNSQYGRSQDLLHLHIDCLGGDARKNIAELHPTDSGWSKAPVQIAGHPYYVRAVMGETLSVNPFRLVADELPDAKAHMAAWTIGLVGATFDGKPGFWILAGRADPAAGEWGSAESIQDHACKIPLGQ